MDITKRITRDEFDSLPLIKLIDRAQLFNDHIEVFSRKELVEIAIGLLEDHEFNKANAITTFFENDFHDYYIYDGLTTPTPITDKTSLENVYEIVEYTNKDVKRMSDILSKTINILINREILDDSLITESKAILLEELETTADELKYFGVDWENIWGKINEWFKTA